MLVIHAIQVGSKAVKMIIVCALGLRDTIFFFNFAQIEVIDRHGNLLPISSPQPGIANEHDHASGRIQH